KSISEAWEPSRHAISYPQLKLINAVDGKKVKVGYIGCQRSLWEKIILVLTVIEGGAVQTKPHRTNQFIIPIYFLLAKPAYINNLLLELADHRLYLCLIDIVLARY